MPEAFPNVPAVPGVPPLARPPGFVPTPITLMSGDSPGLNLQNADPVQWGIFHADGSPVVTAQSVVTFDVKQDWLVSDYPIEEGSFESYNKVQVPFDVRVRYAAGGSDADRAALIASVRAAADSFDIFDVRTPETIFRDVSIVHWDSRRTARNGVGLIQVDVWCVNVRLLASATFNTTQAPSGAASHDDGLVGAQPATPAQQGLASAIAGGAIAGAAGGTGTVPSTVQGESGSWFIKGVPGIW